MEEKKELKAIEVKRIFFYENEFIPSFELTDGTIKRAYFLGTPQGIKTVWYSETEFEKTKKRIDEKRAKPKIIKINGQEDKCKMLIK